VTVRPSGVIQRDRIGNTSGCYIITVCFEDEEGQISYCEERQVCGEFPAID